MTNENKTKTNESCEACEQAVRILTDNRKYKLFSKLTNGAINLAIAAVLGFAMWGEYQQKSACEKANKVESCKRILVPIKASKTSDE